MQIGVQRYLDTLIPAGTPAVGEMDCPNVVGKSPDIEKLYKTACPIYG
jgi:hypothetical protein